METNNRVALNMSKLSVPQKIQKARLIVESIASNPNVFTNPAPSLITMTNAIDDLELAVDEAKDGAKTKVLIMRDKERDLMRVMNAAAAYVEFVAQGDSEIVHLAGLRYKQSPTRVDEDFEVTLPDDQGAVLLKCNRRAKSLYEWYYSTDTGEQKNWTKSHRTSVSSTVIGNLQSGMPYWFRVVIVDENGQHPLPYKGAVPL